MKVLTKFLAIQTKPVAMPLAKEHWNQTQGDNRNVVISSIKQKDAGKGKDADFCTVICQENSPMNLQIGNQELKSTLENVVFSTKLVDVTKAKAVNLYMWHDRLVNGTLVVLILDAHLTTRL